MLVYSQLMRQLVSLMFVDVFHKSILPAEAMGPVWKPSCLTVTLGPFHFIV